eukprot:8441101-Pyramimonas_sp.AAC.1
MTDAGVSVGESTAILRYIAVKYKPEYYPVGDPGARGKIDFAFDSLTTEVYEKRPLPHRVRDCGVQLGSSRPEGCER